MLFANPGGVARAALEAAPRAVWLDLLDPSEAERAAAAGAAGFAIQSRSDIAEIESSSRVSRAGDVLYLNSPVSYRDADGGSSIAPVGFALSPTRLVTIRFAEMPVFDLYAEAFAKLESPCSAEAFAGLLEALVDRVADVLEHVGADLDQLSRRTFRGGGKRRSIRRVTAELRATLNAIGMYGETIDNLRDTLLGLARIVGYVQQAAAAWTPEDIKQRMVTLRADIQSLNDYDQQLTAKTAFLLDAVMGFINIEQNDVVRVLTVASVVGIPPTFVVGLYGMNFKYMPEYNWSFGYEFGWAMIVLSIVLPLVWFRVKGWF
jgi:magnesium transporter